MEGIMEDKLTSIVDFIGQQINTIPYFLKEP